MKRSSLEETSEEIDINNYEIDSGGFIHITTHHFLHNLQMGRISYTVKLH
jgi:hypothetical protein